MVKPVRLESHDPHAKVDATIIIILIVVLIVFMFLARGTEINIATYQDVPGISWAPVSLMSAATASARSA